MHKNHLVFEKANSILSTYFVPDNEGDADLLNVIQGNGDAGFSF